jgi:hypothetical protein
MGKLPISLDLNADLSMHCFGYPGFVLSLPRLLIDTSAHSNEDCIHSLVRADAPPVYLDTRKFTGMLALTHLA